MVSQSVSSRTWTFDLSLRSHAFIDIYPKIDESYRVQTSGGALCKQMQLMCCKTPHLRFLHNAYFAVSILGWVLIAVLALAEVRNYMTPKFKEHMIVDTSLGQQLRINVNVTFHALTCNEVCCHPANL